MCQKPNEVQTRQNEKAWSSKQHAAKSKGKRKDVRGANKLPAQVKELAPISRLSHRENFINTAFISGQCSRQEAADLYDWYFSTDINQRVRINHILDECDFIENDDAYYLKLEGFNPYDPANFRF